jgi:HPt (histidine-containing phosphotransfer) domain-containing protein
LPVAAPAILNLEELLARVDGDRELLVELFFVFKSSFPANFLRLKVACQQGDAKQVALEGHMLKGMLLNLSAPRAAAAAGSLEQQGIKGELPESPQALSDLQFEADVLILHMDEYTGELGS